MKLLKIGLTIATVGAFLLVAGCTTEQPPQPAQTVQPQTQHVYQGKLGRTSTTNDVNK